MQAELPLSLELELQEMGLLNVQHEELDDPVHTSAREYKFRMPDFDENGEPEF